MQTETADVQTTAIVDRPGQRRGFLATAWPVIALALMLMLLLLLVLAVMGTTLMPLVVP